MAGKPDETATLSIDQAMEKGFEEQSNPDQAGSDTKAVKADATGETEKADEKPLQTQDTDKAQGASAEGAEDQLLSDAEFKKLEGDPKALRKAMNRAFTQKTQALAEERKGIESYRSLITAYENDPKTVVLQLAEQLGLKLSDAQAAKAADAAKPTESNDEVVALLETVYEHDDAVKLAPIFSKLVEMKTGKLVDEKIKPLEEGNRQRLIQEVEETTERELTAFAKDHPLWVRGNPVDKKMAQIGATLLPGPGMTSVEYMDTLYLLATKDVSKAETTKDVINRINKSAASAEEPSSGVSGAHVSPVPSGPMSLDEAMEHAWEGNIRKG